MKKVLLSDGAGFKSSHIVDLLTKNNNDAVVDNLMDVCKINIGKKAKFYEINTIRSVNILECYRKYKAEKDLKNCTLV